MIDLLKDKIKSAQFFLVQAFQYVLHKSHVIIVEGIVPLVIVCEDKKRTGPLVRIG